MLLLSIAGPGVPGRRTRLATSALLVQLLTAVLWLWSAYRLWPSTGERSGPFAIILAVAAPAAAGFSVCGLFGWQGVWVASLGLNAGLMPALFLSILHARPEQLHVEKFFYFMPPPLCLLNLCALAVAYLSERAED